MKTLLMKFKIHWVVLVNKSSNIIDKLLCSVYELPANSTPCDYERELIVHMMDGCTLAQAIERDFLLNNVDVGSALDIADYLEFKLVDLPKVMVYIDVYLGNMPDMELKKQ